jgi:hypothetical protein
MSDNSTIKLYTKEQIVNATNKVFIEATTFEDVNQIVRNLTPIELPSDEAIYIEAQNKRDNIKKLPFDSASFQFGAIWMRDKIGGNNE